MGIVGTGALRRFYRLRRARTTSPAAQPTAAGSTQPNPLA